jgi:hypothetical protein
MQSIFGQNINIDNIFIKTLFIEILGDTYKINIHIVNKYYLNKLSIILKYINKLYQEHSYLKKYNFNSKLYFSLLYSTHYNTDYLKITK